MARLPIPGSDDGSWGIVLNDFLSVEHNSDGTLNTSGSLSAKADDTAVVHDTGNETIAGIKTFSASPIVPTPTDPTHATTKAYVDSTAASGTPDADATTKGKIQLAGDLSGTAASPQIAAGAVVDADINASANIAQSKIAGLTTDLAGKQPLDSDLTAIAGLSPANDDTIQRKAGVWVNRTMAQVKTDLALTSSDVGLSNVNNTSDVNKPVSTAQQAALDLKINQSLLDAKGDLIAASADNTAARLVVGTDRQFLAADSSTSTGLVWKTSPTYNVQDFGASPAASATTNTTAFNATIAASGWPANAAIIEIPPGNYTINGTILIDGGGATSTPPLLFYGHGARISTVTVGQTMFSVTNTIVSTTRISFEGMLFHSNAESAVAIKLHNSQFIQIVECGFVGSGSTAIEITGTSTSNTISRNQFNHVARGILINGVASYTQIVDNQFAEGLTGTTPLNWVEIIGASHGIEVAQNHFYGTGATLPIVRTGADCGRVIIAQNKFFECAQQAIWTHFGGHSDENLISFNQFIRGMKEDIYINGGNRSRVMGNLHGARDAAVTDNTYSAIRVTDPFGSNQGADCVIVGNVSDDSATKLEYVVKVDSTCPRVVVAFNQGLAGVSVPGTDTTVIGNGSTPLCRQQGDIELYTGNLLVNTLGRGIRIKEGTNAKMGIATLVGGTVTVGNTSVTANSRILLTSQSDGGTPGWLRVSARSAGTSFTITSSSGSDTSTVAWQLIEPA